MLQIKKRAIRERRIKLIRELARVNSKEIRKLRRDPKWEIRDVMCAEMNRLEKRRGVYLWEEVSK